MCPIYLSSWANNKSSTQWNIIYSLKNVVIKTTKPHKTIHCVTRREDAVKKLDDFCNFYHVKGIWLCHPKKSHFGMKTVWGWKQLKQKTQKGLCLPPICLQAGQKLSFVKMFSLLSPGPGEQPGDRKLAPRMVCTNKSSWNNSHVPLANSIYLPFHSFPHSGTQTYFPLSCTFYRYIILC